MDDKMNISELKVLLAERETQIKENGKILIEIIDRKNRLTQIIITKRFYKSAKKARIWNTKEMLTALKNTLYGFDPQILEAGGAKMEYSCWIGGTSRQIK